jgi:hypothetical protein
MQAPSKYPAVLGLDPGHVSRGAEPEPPLRETTRITGPED